MLPNDIVTNYTRDYSYALLDLGVAYKEDPERVMAVLKDIFDNELTKNPVLAPKILGKIELQGLNSFENSSIIIRLRIKTVTKEQWNVQREFNKLILKRFKEENKEDVEFWKFVQFKFDKQWRNLKSYANSQGIKFMGDLPLYVGVDSVDVWKEPEYFHTTREGDVKLKSGVPGDNGEPIIWGNPCYNWP